MEKKNKNCLKQFYPYLKPYKVKLLLIFICIFLFNLSYILTGYLNGAAIESVVSQNIDRALFCLGAYFLIEITSGLMNRVSYYFLSKIQIKVSRKLGYDAYGKVMCLPAYAFEELSSGEIINRVTNDTEAIAGSMNRLISILSNIVSSLLILIYIFFNSWIIGSEIIFFLVLYLVIVKYFTKRMKIYDKEVKEKNDTYTAIANESVRGIREIKTLGIVPNLKNHVAMIIKELYHFSVKGNKLETKYDCVSNLLKTLLEVGCFITCAILTYYNQITVTFFVAMTYYIYRYTWLVENVTEFTKAYQKLSVSLDRIHQIVGNELYQDVEYGDTTLKNPKGIITFENVTFHYKNEETLLDQFHITFEPNKKIAIVGASGEGKTTLFNLITRIFDPVEGTISLDNIPLSSLTEESLRENISIIRQEPFLFNRTILENFQLLDTKVTLEEVRKYCKLSFIDDYIMSLPKQYDTILGEGGVNLSGGQKQRLSIARTLLKKAKVILFDEATSALDNESQAYIKQLIDTLSHDHTVLIVAHRLSTIVDADLIYVIKKGKVFAQGTHKELMENCAFYHKLYNTESSIK